MGRDVQDLSFLGPRIMDKVVLALIMMSLYWHVGANTAPSNVNNITAVLFLWTILPGYAAASYMPSIVLERPLFVRCAPTTATQPGAGLLRCRESYLFYDWRLFSAVTHVFHSPPGHMLTRLVVGGCMAAQCSLYCSG
jgi:hypothetical protein